jgi:radical SAM-linked protein
MVVARSAGAAGATHRDVAEAWLGALVAAGLPLARTEGRAKSPIAFGAALPVGMAAERELVDIVLTERWPAWRVREALEGHLPDGWRLVELSDVWLAGPPLGGRVVAADYRLELAGEVDASALERAAGELLAADRLPRERAKGGGVVAYDLRPLLVDVKVQPGSPVIVLTRTRFHPELGTGRPEEVLAALGDRLGTALEARAIVRERILTADDIV